MQSKMTEELKIRIQDYRKTEEHLRSLGAKFLEERNVEDIYFRQPKGKVLKITEDNKGVFLVELKAKNNKFEIERYEPVPDKKATTKELEKKFGVKCVLKKKRRFFSLPPYMVNINLIEGVGEFLIVEGKGLQQSMITEKLKIKSPEFVTVSFDELKQS
jgi:predicted adenylyl cyclase CyaB